MFFFKSPKKRFLPYGKGGGLITLQTGPKLKVFFLLVEPLRTLNHPLDISSSLVAPPYLCDLTTFFFLRFIELFYFL